MTPDLLFSLTAPIAILGWLCLVFLPGSRAAVEIVARTVVPGVLAVAYLAIIVLALPGSRGGFDSLDAVARLFADPWLLLAGWLHYLAFDLLIGAWQVKAAREAGVPHLAIVPSLVLTFLFGPIGFLTFLATRAVLARRPAGELPA
jgi:hypothetical protein